MVIYQVMYLGLFFAIYSSIINVKTNDIPDLLNFQWLPGNLDTFVWSLLQTIVTEEMTECLYNPTYYHK